MTWALAKGFFLIWVSGSFRPPSTNWMILTGCSKPRPACPGTLPESRPSLEKRRGPRYTVCERRSGTECAIAGRPSAFNGSVGKNGPRGLVDRHDGLGWSRRAMEILVRSLLAFGMRRKEVVDRLAERCAARHLSHTDSRLRSPASIGFGGNFDKKDVMAGGLRCSSEKQCSYLWAGRWSGVGFRPRIRYRPEHVGKDSSPLYRGLSGGPA